MCDCSRLSLDGGGERIIDAAVDGVRRSKSQGSSEVRWATCALKGCGVLGRELKGAGDLESMSQSPSKPTSNLKRAATHDVPDERPVPASRAMGVLVAFCWMEKEGDSVEAKSELNASTFEDGPLTEVANDAGVTLAGERGVGDLEGANSFGGAL